MNQFACTIKNDLAFASPKKKKKKILSHFYGIKLFLIGVCKRKMMTYACIVWLAHATNFSLNIMRH